MASAAHGVRDRSRRPDSESVFGYFVADRWTTEKGRMEMVGHILRSLSVGVKRIATLARCVGPPPRRAPNGRSSDASTPCSLQRRASQMLARTLVRADLPGDLRRRPRGIVEMSIRPDESQSYVLVVQSLDDPDAVRLTGPAATTFTVYRLVEEEQDAIDRLRSAFDPVAAGYGLYGRSTQLTVGDRHGVTGFRLDPSIGEFCLTAANLQMPKAGTYTAVTGASSTTGLWREAVTMGPPETSAADRRKQPSIRLGGSLAGHVHNVLRRGGRVRFLSPDDGPADQLDSLVKMRATSFIGDVAGGTVIRHSLSRADGNVGPADGISVLKMGSSSVVCVPEAADQEERRDQPPA